MCVIVYIFLLDISSSSCQMFTGKFDQFAPLEEEEEEIVTRRRRLTAYERTQKVISNIPVMGFVVNYMMDVFREKFMQVQRRRRSFKLALYFQAQMILGLVGFLLFFIVALQDLSLLTDILEWNQSARFQQR